MLEPASSAPTFGPLDLNSLRPMLKWCHQEGLKDRRLDVLLSELIDKILELGIPFDRVNLTIPVLHPQLAAQAATWHSEEGISYFEYDMQDEKSNAFKGSPAQAILERKVEMLEIQLDAEESFDYEFCYELRDNGYTGYVILGVESQDSKPNLLSFATKHEHGFLPNQVEILKLVAESVAPMLAFQRMRSIARNICRTYIGPHTGARVLEGAIRRGTVEKLNAVVWFCDLRKFTQLSEALGTDGVTDFVNNFFEAISNAVNEHEGEILKFIGDAALAIFPIPTPADQARICEDALRAVGRVEKELLKANTEHLQTNLPPIEYGIGLNLGEVCYGNVGAKDRLDFTVIGSAVNLASRLESLSAQTEHRVLISESFAQAVEEKDLKSIGTHRLKGVAAEQEVYCRA